MIIFKCKMCGGDLNVEDGVTVVECEYCGTKQTVPTVDDEKKIALFGRANRLRFACEFDKAAGIYESIVVDFPEEAEAYWGLVLCKYGIEYVDDPATGRKVPTCHRSSFESVMDDENFEQTLENADPIARSVYRDEAKQIEELRRRLIEVSGKEEPYDIFICYKETAGNGERTIDSVIAQDVYDELTAKGYRVFFSRITLEDKLGVEYEPYIFAALHSAKIMLAFGTDYEYYNAVWVKNEWSRFLQLIVKGEKKTLIPCYKGIDAYDMPKEFAKLQAQDMGKVGALQDLLRGIEKIIPKKEATKTETVVVKQSSPQSATVDSMLKRAFLYLEDGEWKDATDYCNRVLDIDPESAEAYVGLLLVDLKLKTEKSLALMTVDFAENKNYSKAIRFASPNRAAIIESYRKSVLANIEEKRRIAEEKVRIAEEKRRLELSEKRKKAKMFSALFGFIGANDMYGLKSDGTIVVTDDIRYSTGTSDWYDIIAVSGAEEDSLSSHMIGLRSDGTVLAGGKNKYGECNVSSWKNIVSVSCGRQHSVGLRSDGTVVAVGNNDDGQCNVSSWRNIVSVSCIGGYSTSITVGLKSDGSVVTTGGSDKYDVSSWTDIVAVIGDTNLFGLRSDGTVVMTGPYANGYWVEVLSWNNIVEIACGRSHVAGLKSDGTVVAVGDLAERSFSDPVRAKMYRVDYGQCDVSSWTNIAAIYCGWNVTVGLKVDGTIIIAGEMREFPARTLSSIPQLNNLALIFRDIVSVSVGGTYIAGLKSNGSITTMPIHNYGYEEHFKKNIHGVSNWKLFDDLEHIKAEQERKIPEMREKKQKQQRDKELMAQRRAENKCPYCGGEFKGIFLKVCKRCGLSKDY